MIGQYRFDGHDELCLSIDRGRQHKILLIAPLFEEANRCRTLLVAVMRNLDASGIDSVLPDLPGQNESLRATRDVDLALWREALAECWQQHGSPGYAASIRGGALVDNFEGAKAVWRLAPLKGRQLLRQMIRAKIAADRERGIVSRHDDVIALGRNTGLILAGNSLSPSMIAALEGDEPDPASPVRTVQLGSEPIGDETIMGSPLWLRAEPGHDPEMARAIAHDLKRWIA